MNWPEDSSFCSFALQFCRMILIAHNIRSLHNVGSILRNAAAFGVECVYLTGITGVPPRKEIAKVSLGAEDLVLWKSGEISEVISLLKQEGRLVFGLDNAVGSIDISSCTVPSDRLALVLGNEVEGIDDDVRAMLSGCLEIPMKQKRSLNVSVACGVALYALQNLHL